TYTVRAFLEGFAEALKQSVQIIAGRQSELSLDLVIGRIAETVTVAGSHRDLPLEASSTLTTAGGISLEIGPIRGDNYEARHPVVPPAVRPRRSDRERQSLSLRERAVPLFPHAGPCPARR